MTDYIYALLCPQGEIRYIGKSTNPEARLKAHISKAKTNQTKHHAANWIRSLLNAGEKPAVEVVFEVPEGEPWEPYEIKLIAEFKAEGHRLTNGTGGGDGFFDVTPEANAKRVAAAKVTKSSPEFKERISRVMREVRSSPEFREAVSKKIKGAWQDPRTRKNFIEGMRKPEAVARRRAASARRYEDPTYGEAQAERGRQAFQENPEAFAAFMSASQTPEAKAKRKASLAVAQAAPEYREKNLAALAEINARPEVKAKKSKAAKENYGKTGLAEVVQSEEFRANQSERLKGRWKDPQAREKMMARWTPEQKALQATNLEARRDKIAAAMTPEVRARQGAKMKEYWAKKREEKLASLTPEEIEQKKASDRAKRAAAAREKTKRKKLAVNPQ